MNFKSRSSLLTILCLAISFGLLSAASEDLRGVGFPPWTAKLKLLELTGIVGMNYKNVSSIYISLLEAQQILTSIKHEMAVTRLVDPLPLPACQPCFIMERNTTSFSRSNITENLICDQHALELFSLALQRVASHEKCHNAGKYSVFILRAKRTLEDIASALSNITGIRNSSTNAAACGLPSLSSVTVAPSEENTRQRLLRCSNGNSLGDRSDTTMSPEDQSRPGILRGAVPDVDPTYQSLLNQPQWSPETTEEEERDATPTVTTTTRCLAIDTDEEQFLYMHEVWLGLQYIGLDLAQKRQCLQEY